MSNKVLIKFSSVGLCYPLPKTSFKNHLLHLFGQYTKDDFWALKNVSFELMENTIIGVIGSNGAGKSSLAKLMAGVYLPDEGEIQIAGKTHLLSVGAGLLPQFTGKQNIIMSACYLGVERSTMKTLLDEIIEFSELGNFIEQPVKTYSSGMRARLAFSIATSIARDVLIIDETLSTGDKHFQKKSMARIKGIIKNAKLVVVISHQMRLIQEVATHVLWLEQGNVKGFGSSDEIIAHYQKEV